jgi:hypothetical protein
VPISIPESLVVALPPILSPSSRTFAELTLVNWRRLWGSRRLDFVIWAGSFNFSIGDISKFFIDKILQLFHRQDQETFSSTRSINFAAAKSSSEIASAKFVINISYRLHRQDLQCFTIKNRRVHPNFQAAGSSSQIASG